jgi:hypothetical protein
MTIFFTATCSVAVFFRETWFSDVTPSVKTFQPTPNFLLLKLGHNRLDQVKVRY